jgi:hypothetical protein
LLTIPLTFFLMRLAGNLGRTHPDPIQPTQSTAGFPNVAEDATHERQRLSCFG